MKLVVREAQKEDVYRDMARIPEIHRKDGKGKPITEGMLCKVTNGNISGFFILRGYQNSGEAVILLDERSRNRLKVSVNSEVDFDFQSAGLWGEFRWAWNASDPAYRVAARMGLLSVVLGFFGVLLGLISLWG